MTAPQGIGAEQARELERLFHNAVAAAEQAAVTTDWGSAIAPTAAERRADKAADAFTDYLRSLTRMENDG